MRKLITVLLLGLTLSACATTTRTETRKVYQPAETVRAGDEVLVRTKDGRKLQFEVTRADAKAIHGKGIAVPRAEIASLKVAAGTATVRTVEKDASPAAQAVSVVAIVLGILGIVAINAVF